MTIAAFRFVGANIKGTPPMPIEKVEDDLELLLDASDILVVQEFRHRWYWQALKNVAKRIGRRSSSPRKSIGMASPVRSAQAVVWNPKVFRLAFSLWSLLHGGRAKISEDRGLNNALLKHIVSKIQVNAWSTHFVVGGDRATDGPIRRAMMGYDLAALDAFLAKIDKNGWPAIGELDANMRRGSESYPEFMRILKKHGYIVHGVHGVEYLVTKHGRKASIEVIKTWDVGTDKLWTDHESRGATVRLVKN